MSKKIIMTSILMFMFFIASVSAVLLSDQGTNVKNSTGSLLSLGNLTIEIYNASSEEHCFTIKHSQTR